MRSTPIKHLPTNTLTALEKRIRRALAKQQQYLLKARPDQVQQIGEYALLDARRVITSTHRSLAELGKELGVMADDERLERPVNDLENWRYYIARQETIEVDGRRGLYNNQISPEFATQEGARSWLKAAGTDADGLVLVGFDTTAGKRMGGGRHE